MSSSLLDPLNLLMEQSQELLTLAGEQDWQTFETELQQWQDAISHSLIPAYFESIHQAGLDLQAKEKMNEIRSIHQQLTALAANQQDEITSEIRQLNRAGKALDAYGQ